MLPFLKWPGGKRWAAPAIAQIVKKHLSDQGTYYEPFLGGGAVFFHLLPSRAMLSDVNEELIEAYMAIKYTPRDIIAELKRLPVSSQEFYLMRDYQPRTRLNRAVRLLYLNRTAFAGIYRVNSFGQFNVPYGGQRTPADLHESDILLEAARAMKKARFRRVDFEVAVSEAERGDVIYCDPTYTVTHDNNCFIRYNERNFSWADQERLVRVANLAVGRGVAVIVSNAHHPKIRDLYQGWRSRTLTRYSAVSPDPERRKKVAEYLFVRLPNGSKDVGNYVQVAERRR